MTSPCSTCFANWNGWCRLFDCSEDEASRCCSGKYQVSSFEYRQFAFSKVDGGDLP